MRTKGVQKNKICKNLNKKIPNKWRKEMSQAKLKVIENNTMDKENRTKSLEAAVNLIEKNYGKGSIMKLGSKANVDIEAISTGSLGLDIALDENLIALSKYSF